MFENRIDLSSLKESVQQIKSEVGKIIVGQENMVSLLITAILADGHVLLEGVPGVAKTLASKILARTIDADFSRIQFTPDLMPSDILGTSIFNMKNSEFEFKAGPIFSNIVLIDEINRSPAKTQAALFEVMEERQVTIDGVTHPMSAPYMVVATQNPIEQEGTYRLPEAQLDRFLFKITVDYPSLEQEVAILANHHQGKNAEGINEINKVLNEENINEYRAKVKAIHIDSNLMTYIAKIINATRKDSSLYLGASPRASVALLISSKAFAAVQGRDFVTPEDIKFVAPSVISHRAILTPEREMEGGTAPDVVQEIINKIEVPR